MERRTNEEKNDMRGKLLDAILGEDVTTLFRFSEEGIDAELLYTVLDKIDMDEFNKIRTMLEHERKKGK